MTATIPVEFVYFAAICLGVLAALAWDRGCKCEKCSFHVNEARMARLKKDEEDHDNAHKMWDNCGRAGCSRNGEKARRLDK